MSAPVEEPEIRGMVFADVSDPASLEAFYSGYGSSFFEHHRKILLASLREVMRARFAANGQKASEARLDDLARCDSAYLQFIEEHLHGRRLWAREHMKEGMGA